MRDAAGDAVRVLAGDVHHVRTAGELPSTRARRRTDDVPDRAARGARESTVEEIDAALLGGPRTHSAHDLADRADIGLDVVAAFWSTLGLPHADADDHVYTEQRRGGGGPRGLAGAGQRTGPAHRHHA